MRRPSVFAPLALLAALVLAGCGEEPAEFGSSGSNPPSSDGNQADDDERAEDAPTGSSEEPADDDPTSEQDLDDSDTDTDSDTSTGPPEQPTSEVDPADVLAETTYPMAASDVGGGTITVGVHDLKVDGETMLLTLYFTPEFDGEEPLNLFEMHGYGPLSPVLNDRANLKQYTVLDDDDSGEWATPVGPIGASADSGDTLVWWGYYAAPEDDIDTIAVSVFSGADELEVRIDR